MTFVIFNVAEYLEIMELIAQHARHTAIYIFFVLLVVTGVS